MTLYLEDVEVGAASAFGTHTFTREEILAFAARYDPQAFHVDEAAAAEGPFGGLIASGWHTAAVWMRLNVEHRLRVAREATARGETVPALGPSPGFRNLRWWRPVRPGDTLAFGGTVTGKRPVTRPGWGLVFSEARASLEDGTPVLTFEGCVMWPRRP